MNEMEYEAVEKETRDYLINQRINYGNMPKDKRLELITTTLLLGGARPNINNARNDCLYFGYKIMKGISYESFAIEYETIKNPAAFADRMEGIDNIFQIPMEARKSLEGRKQYFASRLYNQFSTYDLTKDIAFPEVNSKIIDKNWNQKMQDKMAVIKEAYREDPDRFGKFVEASFTDADEKTTLNRALGMRKLVARATVSSLENRDLLAGMTNQLSTEFGENRIIKNVDEVVDAVNQRSMQDAHEFPAVKDME